MMRHFVTVNMNMPSDWTNMMLYGDSGHDIAVI